MGSSKSKPVVPNNPFELDRERKRKNEEERNKVKKRLEKQKEKEAKRLKKEEKLAGKRKKKSKKLDDVKQPQPPHVPRIENINFEETTYDLEAKQRMINQLGQDTPTFLLNQIMMSVQFYGNYEREMMEAVERNRKQENEKTSKISQHCKTILLPDRLHEAVDNRVKFLSRHGPLKNKQFSLHNQTIYIIFENIEISNPGETSDYSNITDTPTYKLEIDDVSLKGEIISKNPGYIKLRSLEVLRKKQNLPTTFFHPNADDDDDDDDDDSDDDIIMPTPKILNSRNSIMINSNRLHRKPMGFINGVPTTATTPSPPSSEYDYAYITALNTPQPLIKMRSSNASTEPLSCVVLPESCITNVRVKRQKKYDPHADDDEESDDDDSSEDEDDDDTHETKQYLGSKTFLGYFINTFHEFLAENLEISSEDLEQATWKGACIYSNPWEIIPAISGPWPKIAIEWKYRQRKIKENPLTKQRYEWPSVAMVNKVVSFGCHVVPIGYAPKNETNPERELEWKIVFPKAERYLESCLTNSQTKVYMVCKSLFKTFVDQNTDSQVNMFTSEHLRHHLFWQCENNSAAWSEDFLGEALIRFLNSLLQRIQTHRLPDYFLPQRNLFENIPEKMLVELHRRIYRITEFPVMHLLIALKNVKFVEDFYPRLRFKHLYNTIIIDNPLKILNPKFRDEKDVNLALEDSEEEEVYGAGLIGYNEKKDKNDKSKKKRTRKVHFQEAEKIKKMMKNQKRKESVEPFDKQFFIKKCFEPLRRKIIIEYFITHYIAMAQQAFIFRSMNQSLMFLKHAERLCNILQDDQCADEAIRYMNQIQPLQNEYSDKYERERNEGPTLPKRESMLEPAQKLRMRNVKKQLTIKEEVDPYTNISSSSFSPQDFDDEIEEIASSRKKSVVLRKKSVGFSAHHMPSASFTPQSFDDEIEEEVVVRKKSTMQRRKSIGLGLQNGSALKNLEIQTKVQIHSNGISHSNEVEDEFDLNALLGNTNGNAKMTNGKVNSLESKRNYDSDDDCDTTF